MNNPLEDFISWIDEYMLSKGKDYWKNGSVRNLERDDNNWEADVYGSDNYLTEVTIKKGQVAGWRCNYPYDHGPICKHTVAVLFAVKEKLPKHI